MKRTLSCLVAVVAVAVGLKSSADETANMKKIVTSDANFALYAPEGWETTEQSLPGVRVLHVADPQGKYEASMLYGLSWAGNNAEALAKTLASLKGQKFPDLQIGSAYGSNDHGRAVLDATYTHPAKGARELRVWIAVKNGYFTCSIIEVPRGELTVRRQQLLTILSNVKLTKGSFQFKNGTPPALAELEEYKLSDGSASMNIPKGWKVRDLGTGEFIASAPNGPYCFIVGTVQMLTPQLGVSVPGAIVSDYATPHEALKLVTSRMQVAGDMRFLEVIPRRDLAEQIGQVHTAGPVQVEEFLQNSTAKSGEKTKGYTFGISFGSRVGTHWRFWHMTVSAPADKFDTMVPTFAAMMQSYRINDAFASEYIARGMARLREMQQQTAELVARNAREIHDMMQGVYDERMKSWDYIDYQRTNYIRGEQDWISSMEGGSVYHTDSWGTLNTDNGNYYSGKAYDYVHFNGGNPIYNESMTPINSRDLWEKHIAR
jgi:hypothetical protein